MTLRAHPSDISTFGSQHLEPSPSRPLCSCLLSPGTGAPPRWPLRCLATPWAPSHSWVVSRGGLEATNSLGSSLGALSPTEQVTSRALSLSLPCSASFLQLQKGCWVPCQVPAQDSRKGQPSILRRTRGPACPLTRVPPHGNLTGISN